ncbi:MAG: hypothetical protein R3A80_08580 [Bdellovibrionota bacterium]
MNHNFLSALCLVAAFASAPLMAESIWVNLPVEHVYVPKGFDSNDNAQVIVSGTLPSFCYKAPEVSFTLNENVIQVSVRALYNESHEEGATPCAQVAIPFLEKVSMGVLTQGTYQVQANADTSNFIQEELAVDVAASVDINDHMYARVDSVETKEKSRWITLKGYNPSDCFELDYIKYIPNGKDTYSVLPVMKKVRAFCPRKMMEFAYDSKVPQELDANQILLHVRTMQGDSVNKLFENKPAPESN